MNQSKYLPGSHNVIFHLSLWVGGWVGHIAAVVTSGLLSAAKTKSKVNTCITYILYMIRSYHNTE